MSRILMVLGALVLGAGLAAPAAAQSGGIFTVARVPVEATAPSAEEARLIAQDQGRAQAMRILLQRLTRVDDWSYLPRPGLNELLNMQVGFEVERERFSTQAGAENRYLADITYAFRPDLVRGLLRDAGIPFTQSQAAPAVLLPIFEQNGETMLWEEDNPWALALYEVNLTHELVPLSMPLGDITDGAAAPLDAVSRGDWDALRPLARRYGVERVFIAHAVMEGEPETGTLYVRLTEVTENGIGRSLETQVSAGADEDAPLAGLGEQAITILSGRLSEQWKSQTIVSYDVVRQLEATAWFGTLGEWRTIAGALNDMPTVTEHDAYAMSSRGAEVSVTFVGTPEQLAITLNQHGVVLRGEDGRWALRTRSTGGTSDMAFASGPQPPVTVISQRGPRGDSPNAQTLSDDDLGDILGEPLTEDDIRLRREQGLGDQPGTMQPVGN